MVLLQIEHVLDQYVQEGTLVPKDFTSEVYRKRYGEHLSSLQDWRKKKPDFVETWLERMVTDARYVLRILLICFRDAHSTL